MSVCLCVLLGATHLFPVHGGPLRGRFIVAVPCPLPRNIHHREPPRTATSQSQGRALMRTEWPHPSGSSSDHLRYSTGTGTDHTWTPDKHTCTAHKLAQHLQLWWHHIWVRCLRRGQTGQARPQKHIKFLGSHQIRFMRNSAPHSRPLNPGQRQTFRWPFFSDLHGNYIPLYKHRKHKWRHVLCHGRTKPSTCRN